MPAQLQHTYVSRAAQRRAQAHVPLRSLRFVVPAGQPVRLLRGVGFAVLFTWVPVVVGAWYWLV